MNSPVVVAAQEALNKELARLEQGFSTSSLTASKLRQCMQLADCLKSALKAELDWRGK